MNKSAKLVTVLSMIISVFLFYSCKKDLGDPVNPNGEGAIENLQISPDFNWKTTKTVALNLTGYANSLAEVSYGGNGVVRAMLSNEAPVSINIVVPSFQQKVNVKYQGQVVELLLDDDVINYVFN